jgi:hypothetical protein
LAPKIILLGSSMSERDIEAYLVKRVKEIGGESRKVSWVGRRGAPDRLVLFPLMNLRPAIWVELKAPNGRTSVIQDREHQRLRALGQTVVVVTSKEGVDALLA